MLTAVPLNLRPEIYEFDNNNLAMIRANTSKFN